MCASSAANRETNNKAGRTRRRRRTAAEMSTETSTGTTRARGSNSPPPMLTEAHLNTMVSVARAGEARSLVSLARGPAEAEKPQQQTKQTTKTPYRTHAKSTGSESFPDHARRTSESTRWLAMASPVKASP